VSPRPRFLQFLLLFVASLAFAEDPAPVDVLTAAYPGAIKLPDTIKEIAISELFEFSATPAEAQDRAPYVVRRMTKTHFEVWTPKHGWLFDRTGKVINQAAPPRRDGDGRHWYGAFLPDGRWVTTDLWSVDRTLTFFSAKGQWLRERSSVQLAPVKKTDTPLLRSGEFSDIIAWARCDREGRGWIASVGTENGRAIVFVSPESVLKKSEKCLVRRKSLCCKAWDATTQDISKRRHR
jgi:hypothetical protein